MTKIPALACLCLSISACSSIATKEMTWMEPGGFTVQVTEYEPRGPAREVVNTTIILPPTGGSTVIERRYAGALSGRGQRVLLVKEWTGLDSDAIDLDVHNRLYGNAHRAVGAALRHATGEVGILGTSLGALYGLSAVSRYPEIKRAVLIVGGYSFTDVIVTSDYPTMKALREQRMKAFGFADTAAYRTALESVFRWNDPDRIRSDQMSQTKLLLFQGTKDEAVPTPTQQRLAALAPNAKVIALSGGHFWTIIKTWFFHSDDVVTHLAP